MFLLHAPLAQVFFKKSVASRIFGAPMPRAFFPVYLLVVFLGSQLINEALGVGRSQVWVPLGRSVF